MPDEGRSPIKRDLALRILFFLLLLGIFGVPAGEHRHSGALLLVIVLAWLNTKVGYRWFDIFLLLIPIVGQIYICKILWRTTNLPNTYWPPRPTA